MEQPHDDWRREMIHDLARRRRNSGLSPPLLPDEQWILDWLEAEELILGGLHPGTDDCAGHFLFGRYIHMNSIELSGKVVSISRHGSGEKRVANCLLREYNGKQPLTYQASFWGEDADYILKNVNNNDDVALTGYAYQIISAAQGPYLVLRNCELQYIVPRKKIAVEDLKSLRKKEDETNGTVS